MGERRGTKGLELWCKKMTEGYPGVKIDNMTTSWRDGLAFCAMIHHFRPELIDFAKLNKDDVYHNNELAFRVAEQYLGIPALLDAEDMVEYAVPDRLSILTYLSQFYQAFEVSRGSASRVVPKRPATVPDRGIVSPASTSPPTKMTIRSGRANEGFPPRKPCDKCGLPVFIGERLTVGKLLFHRTCFRCARCDAKLTPTNYYETETNKFCCETCPDEIAAAEALTSRSISDEQKSILKESTMYKTALEFPEFEVSETISDESEFVKARSFFMNTQLENDPPKLPKSKPPESVKNNSEVLAIDLTVSFVNNSVKTENLSATKEVKSDDSCCVIEESTGDGSCLFIDNPLTPNHKKLKTQHVKPNFDDNKSTAKDEPPDTHKIDNLPSKDLDFSTVQPQEKDKILHQASPDKIFKQPKSIDVSRSPSIKSLQQPKSRDTSRPSSILVDDELLDFQKVISNLKPVKRKSLEKKEMKDEKVEEINPKIEVTPVEYKGEEEVRTRSIAGLRSEESRNISSEETAKESKLKSRILEGSKSKISKSGLEEECKFKQYEETAIDTAPKRSFVEEPNSRLLEEQISKAVEVEESKLPGTNSGTPEELKSNIKEALESRKPDEAVLRISEELESRIPKEELKSRISEEELKSRISEEELKSRISEEELKSRISEEELKSRKSEEELKSRISEEELKSRISEEELKSRISEEELKSRISKEGLKSRISEEELKSRISEEELKSRISEEELKSRISEEELKSRISKEGLKSRISEEELKSRISEEELKSRISEEELKSRISKEGLKSRISEEELKSRISEEELKSRISEKLLVRAPEELKSNVQEELKSNIEAELKSRISDEPTLRISDELKKTISEEELKNRISKGELLVRVPEELKSNTQEELRSDIEKERKSRISDDPIVRISPDFKDRISEEEVLVRVPEEPKSRITETPETVIQEQPEAVIEGEFRIQAKSEECRITEEVESSIPEELESRILEEPKPSIPEELESSIPEELQSRILEEATPSISEELQSRILEEATPSISEELESRITKRSLIEKEAGIPVDLRTTRQPEPQIKREEYPEDLNPFDDEIPEKAYNPFDDEEDEEVFRPQPKPRSKKSGDVLKAGPFKSTNPFGDDEEEDDCSNPFGDGDDEEEVKKSAPKVAPRDLNRNKNSEVHEGFDGQKAQGGLRVIQVPTFRWSETLSDESDVLSSSCSFNENRPLRLIPAPRISMPIKFIDDVPIALSSPFDSDIDDYDDEGDPKSSVEPPQPKPRSSGTSILSEGSFSSNVSSPASSAAPSLRKKKAAPRPPIPFDKQRDSSPNPSTSLQASPSPRSRKVRRAPLPPYPTSTPLHDHTHFDDSFICSPISGSGTLKMSTTSTLVDNFDPSKTAKDETNRNRQSESNISYSLSAPNKSTFGKWKRKKGQAPLRPVPIMREVKPLPMAEVRNELDTIEIQLQGLGKQTVRLEEIIRDKCEGPDADPDSPISEEAEDLIIQMFELINEKNELVRRQAELMYLQRQQRLEREHAEVEYEIRCLMLQPEENKTDFDKEREEELIKRLVDIVERRSEVIECLEMDRRRAAEEDLSINSSMNSYASKGDESLSPSNKEHKKKKKFKNKFKLKGGSKVEKVDADKDVDESEVASVALNKVKKKKFNLF